jgi:hypothetical protein
MGTGQGLAISGFSLCSSTNIGLSLLTFPALIWFSGQIPGKKDLALFMQIFQRFQHKLGALPPT